MQNFTRAMCVPIGSMVVAVSLFASTVQTQVQVPRAAAPASAQTPNPSTPPVIPTPDYVIGYDDVLMIAFWRDKDLSAEVVVRPDGKISVPLVNDIQAAGLTPEELRLSVTKAATKFVEDPTVSVVVKQINSRKVYVMGSVAKPGYYSLAYHMTVLQLLAVAGGVSEYADKENIVVMRTENGVSLSYKVNYEDLTKRKNLQQNIELKPGDTVIVR